VEDCGQQFCSRSPTRKNAKDGDQLNENLSWETIFLSTTLINEWIKWMDRSINQKEPKLNMPNQQQNTVYKQDTYSSKYEILEGVQEVQ